jgi:transmembrane sensor
MEITTELLEKYLAGQASPAETSFVESWMQSNALNNEDLKQLMFVPEGVGLMLQVDREKDQDWEKIKMKFSPVPEKSFKLPIMRIAAAIAILFAVSVLFFVLKSANNNYALQIIKNSENAVKKVTLPDSSFVFLNKGAEIRYSENFSDARDISMQGEVFFDVKRDPSKTFTIAVGECKVQVLGTSFNIVQDSAAVEIVVTSGKVSFQSSQKQKVFLEKGDKASYSTGTKTITQGRNQDLNYLSWKTGILQFENTSLELVVKDLEKYFRTDIEINAGGQTLPTFSSYFEQPTLNEVLNEMKQVLEIDYTIRQGKVILTTKD